MSDPICQNCAPADSGWLCRGIGDPKCWGGNAGGWIVTDANGKLRFSVTHTSGESGAPTVTCSRCGDTISASSNYCTSIADCVNLPIRSKWIIPGDGK